MVETVKPEPTAAPAEVPAEEPAEEAPAYIAGTYTSTQTGMATPFDIIVTFSDNAIESIEAGENKETFLLGSEAIRILSERIVTNQSLDVDMVSGATFTSMAVVYGVQDCVEQAGGDVEALKAVPVRDAAYDAYADMTNEAEVLIVGGGLAGVTAAIKIAQAGGDVLLLERKEFLGGNAAHATGTVLIGPTSIQAALGHEVTKEDFINWCTEHSHGKKVPWRIELVADEAQNLVDFYDSIGVSFNKDKVNGTDGSVIPYGHMFSPSSSAAFSQLIATAEEAGVQIRYATTAESLIQDESGKVIGVNATNFYGEPVEYYGEHVVLATGCFGDNPELIEKYWGEKYLSAIYGCIKGMDGKMHQAAMAIGADTIHMEDINISANVEYTKRITTTTNLIRNCGGIIVRQSTGQRFSDEQSNHCQIVAADMVEVGDPYYWTIYDHNVYDYSEAIKGKALSFVDMNLVTEYDSIEALAEGIGVDAAALKTTIEEYNAAVRGEKPDEFGRTGFYRELSAPFYAMKCAVGYSNTNGGLMVDQGFHVLNTEGAQIPGLYAIGEIAGGYLIEYSGGDGLGNAAITGMVLGRQLAEEVGTK